MMAMKNYLPILVILCEIVNAFMLHSPTQFSPKRSLSTINMQHDENEPIFLRNPHSYYNVNKILSNESSHISRIYTTYNHKYSIIIYKCGKIEHHFNQTLKLKCNQDIIQLNIVSMKYFRKIYEDICAIRKEV
jgi:hypothetical protein